ncbi:MAG TPA: Mur ligase family protein [Longimicrobiales bacterium]|nr:Mur ligase family protein [Longimicrobiales bacterium]
MTDQRPLHSLLADAGIRAGTAPDAMIRAVVTDSRQVTPGALFIAIPGTQVDGATFIADAVAAGAAAIVAQGPGTSDQRAPVPLIHVPDARAAAARLAGAWYGHPARRMRLLGITGTVGKTSVLSIAEALLHASGVRVASIGSLGLRIGTETAEESRYTVPEPLLLHRWLQRAADAECDVALMEVTSHALVQQRVAGLRYEAGAFTNLVPLEHAEFHRNFRTYVESKTRFFDHLAAGAPLAFNAEDRAVSRIVRERDVAGVACGAVRTAAMRIEDVHVSHAGTRFVLNARRPVPRIDGAEHAPFRLPLELSLLGRSNLINVALATTLALSAGASADAAAAVLPDLTAPRRRMQLLKTAPLILDDTAGHPESVNVVFETVERLRPGHVHVVWAVRGRRGPRINRYNAEALAIWLRRMPHASLVVTRSSDVADHLNRVSDEEYDAFLRPLRRARVRFRESAELRPAVQQVLAAARPDDLVLLLGAQGMNQGAAIAQEWLR